MGSLYTQVRCFMGAIRLELKVVIVDIYCGAFRSKNKCSGFYPRRQKELFLPSAVRSAARTFAPFFYAGLYAMIEHSPEDRGPAMHPCGQPNRPPSNLQRGLSAGFLPPASPSLPEALKCTHGAPLLQVDQTELYLSRK